MSEKSSIHIVNEGIKGIMTPEIPPLPEEVAGVSRAVILLNNREEDTGGTDKEGWKFLKRPITDIPAPDAPEQDYDFSSVENGEWSDVIVPGELEMQGFEIENNAEYYYRKNVYIPSDFAGSRIMLRFDGVYGNSRVWVDGRYVRSHTGGFTAWYCDITDRAVPGEEILLTVGVADLEGDCPGLYNGGEKRPLRDPSWASYYAHHNVCGILRDVSLAAFPLTYPARLHTDTRFDEEYRDARLRIGIQLNSEGGSVEVRYTLCDAEGKVCAEEEFQFTGTGNKRENVNIMTVKEAGHWDAEHPYLYTLRVEVKESGKLRGIWREKVGFREIGFAGKRGGDRNKVYVNGREVKLRGTCRHDVSFRFGRSTTAKEDWEEVRAYKEANINHVRTSHYPVSRHFLDACDALGMYVEQENAACFQGDNGYEVYCEPEDFVSEFTEMVERDRNRPCILIWSLGNESGFETTKGFRMEYDYIRGADPDRPVIFSYPFTVRSLPIPYDILSRHYADVDAPGGLADIPVLHEEYMHIACYNSEELKRDPNVRNFWGESVRKAWDRIFETDGALGGDLWGGIDDIFYLPENVSEKWQSHSEGRAAGYGPWGCVLDVYRRSKPEAWLTKKAYSPIKIDEKMVIFNREDVLIPVRNRFDHTNLNELTVVWSREDGVSGTMKIEEDIQPHCSGVLKPECGRLAEGMAVSLKFYDKYNREVPLDEYVIRRPERPETRRRESGTPPEGISVRKTEEEIIVSAGEAVFTFDKNTAQMTAGEYKGRLILCGGPRLVTTGIDAGEWRKADEEVQVMKEEDRATVILPGVYACGIEACFTVIIRGDGLFHTRYLIRKGRGDVTVKESGIRYELTEGAEKIRWRRDGLYSCYPEDHIGRLEGEACRRNEAAACLRYGEAPGWAWKDDVRDDFLYGEDDAENRIATMDFRALRENIRYFEVEFPNIHTYLRVTDENGQAAAGVSVVPDGAGGEKTALRVINRLNYPDLGWGNYDRRAIRIGRGDYGEAVMRFGETRQ